MGKEKETKSLLDRWKNAETKKSVINPIKKAPDGIRLPLSAGQKRLWFLQQMYPKNPFYNYSETYTFNGKLIIDILVESLKRVYNDHDILKTTYHIIDNEIFQKVDKNAEISLKSYDFSKLSYVEATTEAKKIIEANATISFDLTKSPLVHTSLIKMNSEEYILQITLHHIVMDKWSMRIFREDLANYYKELTDKVAVSSRRTELQYSDYAHWLKSKEINESHLSYWKDKLSGEIPNLNLPTDYKRPVRSTFKGAASFTQIYKEELSNKLLLLSKQLETTPYVLMLSVFYVFLHKYSGQTDILIGSPVTNRDQKALEKLIGFFIDTIVLRTEIKEEMSFANLVKDVRKNTLEAFANKDIAFDILVKELKLERSLSINPFFQTMFLYSSVSENPVFGPELSVNHTLLDSKASKFDLTIFVSEDNGILSSTFEYASDLFQEATINRFQEYFKLLLEGVVLNPDSNIFELSMLTSTEKQFFEDQDSNVSNNFSEFKGIHKVIEDISTLHPNRTAVTYKEDSITYKELNKKANLLASNLLGQIKTPNEIVGLCVNRSLDMIVGMLAILKSGCAYLPIDPEYPEKRISYMLNDAKVDTIITQQSLTDLFLEHNVQQLHIDKLNKLENIVQEKFPEIEESDFAYIIYTSGSTGKPKGVSITHKNIINSTSGRLDFYDESPSAFLLMSSISFDSSKAGIFWTLCSGGNLVIAEKRIEQDIEKVGEIIDKHNISHTLMLPSLYELILVYIFFDKLKSLKTVIVAGEICYPTLCEKHFKKLDSVKLYNEYGPTEATVWCIAHQITEENRTNTTIPIGKPVAGAKVYLLDNHLNLVPFGSVGEIYVGGEGLSNGYLYRPELTSNSFINNPFRPSEKIYKTGDLGRYTNNNDIEFLGRSDQQIKNRGFRVELNEIEKAIKSFDMGIGNVKVFVDDEVPSLDFENMNQSVLIDNLTNIFNELDNEEVNEIFLSIKTLKKSEKDYLLNQLEA